MQETHKSRLFSEKFATRKRICGNGSPESPESPDSPDIYQICFHHSYLCFVLLLCLDSDIRCLQVHLIDTVITCSTFLLNLFSILKKELVALALPLFRLQSALSPPLLGLGAWGLQMQITRILQNIICLFKEMEFQPEAQQTHVLFSSCSPPSPHELGTDPVQREHVDIFFLKRGVATFLSWILLSVCFYNFQTFWCSTLSSVCLSILASGTHSSQFLFHPL